MGPGQNTNTCPQHHAGSPHFAEHRLSQVRLSMVNSRGNNISIMLDLRSIIIPIAKVDSTRTLS